MPRRSLPTASLLLLTWSLAAPALAERTLHWRELAVTARLDADGRLHVRELHAMVFSGDWNGGERVFALRLGQKLKIERVSRLDPSTGEARTLEKGDLDEVDRYGWRDNALRWRSRLPTDPQFESTEIDYELQYVLSNVLVVQDGGYLLDHDFAFPDREWPVERFILDLELDPVWVGEQGVVGRWEPGGLPPGRGFVVTTPLRFVGAGKPAGVLHPTSPALGLLLSIALAGIVAALLARFILSEERPGRWAHLPRVTADPAWIEANLLAVAPEVVGALWDRSVGAPEVAATLARMVGESKLQSSVRPDPKKPRRPGTLELRLLVDPGTLSGYEAELVSKLFVDGNTTDTEKVRAHYKDTGFDPTAVVSEPLYREVDRLLGSRPTRWPSEWKLPLALTTVAVLLLLAGGILRSFAWPAVLLGSLGVVLSWGWALGTSTVVARSVSGLAWKLAGLGLILGTASAGFAWLALSGLPVGGLVLVGLWAMLIAAWASALSGARGRDRGAALGWRRQLSAIREAFRHELSKPDPALRDTWFPWIVALGLGPRVERWVRAFAVSFPESGLASSTAASTGSGIAGGGSGWSGGGGAFGGAGASSSWAAAAGALSSGVASPSSSGGGGGSSGGGGGGGW
jgi:uncharacterized membrane protein YgcG